VRYDLQVNCVDCKQIYLNGNVPMKGPNAHLKSKVPVQISMYLGNYKTVRKDSTYFLNPDITPAQIDEFGQMTSG